MSIREYVLITAARNEELHIGKTLESVVAQTALPKRWVIVSDGSTDRTDEIVTQYAKKYQFIQFLRAEGNNRPLNFASKVYAIYAGYEQLKKVDYDVIGHLDADVSFDPHYYENNLVKFQQNPKLGITGGFIYEPCKEHFKSRPFNMTRSVAGGIQFFRRECYEAIGGFIPIKMGGEDTYAEVMARMRGWEVQAFPELKVFHHKRGLAIRGNWKESFRFGLMDYSLGYHPLFEIMKCIHRINERPYIASALLRMYSFIWSYCRGEKRPVSNEFIRYVRKEQIDRLRAQIRIGIQRLTGGDFTGMNDSFAR